MSLPWSQWFPLNTGGPSELRLYPTLFSGQAFRWREVDGVYQSVWRNTLVQLRETETDCEWRSLDESIGEGLVDYFQLSTPLAPLYSQWGRADERLDANALQGLRVMRQDPLECLFSFICSQNNNIARISKMIETLCEHYGTKLTEASEFHAFPTLEQLLTATEDALRSLGFGYRARFIVESARHVHERGGEQWLSQLRADTDVRSVTAKLMELTGVGRKVADCVALYSMDKTDCVPVDTHIWDVAARYYDKSLAAKTSLTAAVHDRISLAFVDRFGTHAGWAQSVLFAAELPRFSKKRRK